MGWTSYQAIYYTRSGAVDRKAECDRIFTEDSKFGKWEVLKSSMHGSVYYAAVRRTRPDGESYVFGAVCLTSVDRGEFYYKDMDESMGPGCYDCPVSILNMLSPTDNEWALAWRAACRERAKNKNRLGDLPVGSVIEYEYAGKTERAVKRAAAYQFKSPWWQILDGALHYIKKKNIPENFRVVSAEAAVA